MNNNLKRYSTIRDGFSKASDLNVGAFVGGKYGKAIQFTIGNEYACLSEKQLVDLVGLILMRIDCEEGYSATDGDLDESMEALELKPNPNQST